MAKRIYACPNCGLQVGVNDNVCTNCGTSLENKVIIENGKVVANNNQVNKDSTVRFSNDPTFSLTHNLITNESPLLIKKADLYTRSNIIDLNIEFMNLSNKNIKAIKVIVYCLDTAMRELEEVEFNYLDLNEEKYNTFGYNKSISIKNKQTRAFDLKVSEIIFDDLSTYSFDTKLSQWYQILDNDLKEIETDILYLNTLRQYNQCQNVRDYKNVIETLKPIEDYKDSKNIIEDCYVKIHGKAYENQQDTIEGLEQTIKVLSEIKDWNNVNQEIEDCEKEIIYLKAKKLIDSKEKNNQIKKDKYKKAITLYEQIIDWKDSKEEIERCREEIEKCDELMNQSNKKRKKYMIIAICSLCLLVIGYFVVDNFIIPTINYNEAISLLENGEYNRAITKFKELGDYKDSKEMIRKGRYEKAIKLQKEGKSTNEELAYLFIKSGDYKDSRKLADTYIRKEIEKNIEDNPLILFGFFEGCQSKGYQNFLDKFGKEYSYINGISAMKDGELRIASDYFSKSKGYLMTDKYKKLCDQLKDVKGLYGQKNDQLEFKEIKIIEGKVLAKISGNLSHYLEDDYGEYEREINFEKNQLKWKILVYDNKVEEEYIFDIKNNVCKKKVYGYDNSSYTETYNFKKSVR